MTDRLRSDEKPPDSARHEPPPSKPNEFTAVAPEFSGKVSNRPTPTGAEVREFDFAEEQERQEDA